jgi:hypothetical protein
MAKKEIVDGLIANKAVPWEEKDREQLMLLNEDILKKMVPEEKKKEEPPPAGGKKEEPPPANTQNQSQQPPPAGGAPAVGQQVDPLQDYIAKAPPAIQHILTNGVAVYNQERTRQVDIILKNERNPFKKEQLEALDINTLYAMARLAETETTKQTSQPPQPSYLGLAPVQNAAAPIVEEPLDVPTLNFQPRKAS